MTTAADPFARPTEPGDSATPGDDLIVGGRYKLPDPDGKGKDTKFTRATTFAKTIADTYRLSLWSQRMVAKGVTMSDAVFAKVASTPLDKRQELDDAVEEAKQVAGAKDRATLGTAVHAFAEQIDRGELTLEKVPVKWRPDVAAYMELMRSLGLEVVLNEQTVLNRTYDIAGTLDRVVRLTKPLDVQMPSDDEHPSGWVRTIPAGTLVILDLKTGRSLEYGWREIAIQLALYANSELVLNREEWSYDPMPDGVDTLTGLVVHLPVGEGKATLHAVDLVRGWRAAWLCQQARTWNRLTDLASPVMVVEAEERTSLAGKAPLAIAGREPNWTERIESAQTITGLQRIKIDAERQRKWTPTLQRLAEKRRDDILADVSGS